MEKAAKLTVESQVTLQNVSPARVLGQTQSALASGEIDLAILSLQRAIGNRAVLALRAGQSADPRPVQPLLAYRARIWRSPILRERRRSLTRFSGPKGGHSIKRSDKIWRPASSKISKQSGCTLTTAQPNPQTQTTRLLTRSETNWFLGRVNNDPVSGAGRQSERFYRHT